MSLPTERSKAMRIGLPMAPRSFVAAGHWPLALGLVIACSAGVCTAAPSATPEARTDWPAADPDSSEAASAVASKASASIVDTPSVMTPSSPAVRRTDDVPAKVQAPMSPTALTEWIQGSGMRRLTRNSRALPIAGMQGQGSAFSVVELPQVGPNPSGRPHRALQMRSEWATRSLRDMGFEASECAFQFRSPSKVSQNRDGVKVDFQAQFRFGCRF